MRSRLRYWGSILGLIAGAAFGAFMVQRFGTDRVLQLVKRGTAGLGLIILFHCVQIALTAMAWRTVSQTVAAGPSVGSFALLRWLREGINGLLPVLPVGGFVLAVRLLCRSGQTATVATAATIVDTSAEMVSQIAFTLFGLAVLSDIRGAGALAPGTLSGFMFFSGATVAAVAAQRLGGAKLAERLARRLGWQGAAGGLHAAITDIYRSHRALGSAVLYHLFAWLLGSIEVAMIFEFLGQEVSLDQALVVESLGQAVRTMGLAVPGAVGIQESGFVLVCGLLGLGPDLALALSLVKRLRDVAFGIPSIALWLWLEARERDKGRDSADEI